MASLHFPNHEALRIALVSGVIPAAVAKAAVSASIPPLGGLWLTFEGELPGEAYASLQRLGAKAFGSNASKESTHFPCWAALLPLRLAAKDLNTEGLFELPVERLPRFIATLERLDEQPLRFAILERTAVVRVTKPSEYLKGSGAEFYYQVAKNAWCLAGFGTVALPAKLLDTDGLTLAKPERDWCCLHDISWHSSRVAQPLSASIPTVPNPIDTSIRLAIPLKLRASQGGEFPEPSVWVAEGGIPVLTRYFRDWDERSLRRLEFAIVRTSDGSERILIRRAGGSRTTPFLTAPFHAYSHVRASQKVLCPVRAKIVPPVRLEFLDSLAGSEPGALAWLEPNANGFAVCRTSAQHFRKLSDAFTYTTPSAVPFHMPDESAPLFTLPGFVVASESKPAGDSPAPPKLPAPRAEGKARSESWLHRLGRLFPGKKERIRSAGPASQIPTAKAKPIREFPNEWAVRRQHLERTLADMPSNVADPIRAHAWQELAQLAHTMGHAKDAADAWTTAIWFKSPAPLSWFESWYRAELDAAGISGTPDDEHLADRAAEVSMSRVFAARISLLAAEESEFTPAARWLKMDRAVRRNAAELPIRSCWLAKLGAARLTKGDTLGLAGERDAIVARLAEGGLDADLDSPGFLRYQGKLSVLRFHATSDWLWRAREAAQRWLKSMSGGGRLQWSGLECDLPSTRAYADLLFACGAAQLGDRQRCRDWMDIAQNTLCKAEGPGVESLVHSHLVDRFRHIIRTRHRRESAQPFKKTDVPEFAQRELSKYAVEKLQSHLSVFEPTFHADPYGHRGLQSLLPGGGTSSASDVRTLLDEAKRDRTAKNLPPRVLMALELADDAATFDEVLTLLPLALELLPETLRGVSPQSDIRSPYTRRAVRAVVMAGRAATRFGLSGGFAKLCGSLRRSSAEGNRSAKEVLAACSGRIFATCRALELFDEISELLTVAALTATAPSVEQLPCAIGWYAIGEDDRGLKILNDARHRLFEGGSYSEKERGDTALAYARALAHAPAAMVPGRLEELFQRLDRVPVGGAASRYYALRPLEIIDAAIAAVVTDEFALDPAARTWLFEDEFRVRQKITRDLERALDEEAP